MKLTGTRFQSTVCCLSSFSLYKHSQIKMHLHEKQNDMRYLKDIAFLKKCITIKRALAENKKQNICQ